MPSRLSSALRERLTDAGRVEFEATHLFDAGGINGQQTLVHRMAQRGADAITGKEAALAAVAFGFQVGKETLHIIRPDAIQW